MKIRPESPRDVAAIHDVNRLAFDTPTEANLVDALRAAPAQPYVSLVADDEGAIVGHILFTPVSLPAAIEGLMGLAPMAVVPARQRQGIGSALVRAGLDACRQLGAGAVVVLGHAEYYPRFGFVPASRFGLASEYDVPDDVFLALELREGFLRGRTGTIRYHPAFASV